MQKKRYMTWLTLITEIALVIAVCILVPVLWNRHIYDITHPKIIESADDRIAKGINFTNGWRSALFGGNGFGISYYTIVQVGTLKKDPRQGVAVISHENANGRPYAYGTRIFLTPTKHGTLRVDGLGAKDFDMSVTAEDGFVWIFNVYNGFTACQ